MKIQNKLVYFFTELFYRFLCGRHVLHLDERNNVEVAVSHVPLKGIKKIRVFCKQGLKFWKKTLKIFCPHHEVINEGSGPHAVRVLSQKIEAFPSHDNILLRLGFILCNPACDRIRGHLALRCLGLLSRFFGGISRELS